MPAISSSSASPIILVDDVSAARSPSRNAFCASARHSFAAVIVWNVLRIRRRERRSNTCAW
jgi:hypothetical protein